MAAELEGLLNRIQKEGVDRAEAEAAEITKDAKDKAKAIIIEAEAQAKALLEKAETESKRFQERSENAISQAARDIILSVGEAVTETFRRIISQNVDKALDDEALPQFIQDAIRTYTDANGAGNIVVLLNEKQKEAVTAYFMSKLADEMKTGLTIEGDRSVISGFTVSLKDSGVQHDFTGEALTSAIGELLRPQLAEIVSGALQNKGKTATT
jgi:V/A-type H+-transporting ATPase subunit E